ncbi:hypothetical protein [Streptomyces specialis]|uniref:hypothetical protein n=1 Tax=Streptomyces specialis TaxID=498367 RepID=UPI00099EB601
MYKETAALPRATDDHSPAADDDTTEFGRAAELPRRRRGQALAAAHGQALPVRERPRGPAAHTPAETAARFGAFRRAVQGREQGQGDDPGAYDSGPASPAPSSSSTPSPHPEDDTP